MSLMSFKVIMSKKHHLLYYRLWKRCFVFKTLSVSRVRVHSLESVSVEERIGLGVNAGSGGCPSLTWRKFLCYFVWPEMANFCNISSVFMPSEVQTKYSPSNEWSVPWRHSKLFGVPEWLSSLTNEHCGVWASLCISFIFMWTDSDSKMKGNLF